MKKKAKNRHPIKNQVKVESGAKDEDPVMLLEMNSEEAKIPTMEVKQCKEKRNFHGTTKKEKKNENPGKKKKREVMQYQKH